MSKALQEKINQLFEQTKDLRSLEEIKPYCEAFNEWLNTSTNYSHATLGTKLSAYGFYKKFKSIPLEQDKNAVSIAKHNADGTVKGYELKHYATVLCGLDKEQWNQRNQTTRVIDRLENSTEIDPDRYLETTGKLLTSDDPHELAVGLIAATGRRPHEILARAKFTAIVDKPYHVVFAGQGKKRGETPTFEIATLYPAEQVIKALTKLRREPGTQALLKEVSAQFPKSETRQNVEIDNRRGQSLRRVVRMYFGDKGENTPVLAFRHGEEQDNNKALRAAYAVLATERDCKGSFGAKIFYASKLLGHFVKEMKDDRDLARLGVSAGYSDYYTNKPVGFPSMPQKERVFQARVVESDFETLKQLQADWNLPNQQSVINRLLESQNQTNKLERQLVSTREKIAHMQEALASYEKQINQLQVENQQLKQDKEIMSQQPQTTEASVVTSDSRIDKLEARMDQVMALLEQMVSGATVKPAVEELPAQTPTPTPTASPARTTPRTRQEQEIDWESVSNDQLKGMKVNGAVEEKIFRAYKAIASYNDNAPSNDDRWYVGVTVLSQVSGCNRQNIGDWVKVHQLTVDDHNNKYGLGQYHNKRHKKVEITDKVRLWE